MGISKVRLVALFAVVGLVAGVGSAGASARPGTPARASTPFVHYSGKGLVNPNADLSVAPALDPAGPLAATSSTGPELGDGHRFNTWSGYTSRRFPEAVATGDFNGDGSVDVAYARSDFFAQGMTVQFNLGDGTMGPAASYPAATESTDIKAGDVNGDGHLDLVLASLGSSLTNNVIDVYINDGLGTFTHRTSTGGEGPQKMALADLDGDGDVDLAMSSGYFSTIMSVLVNDGTGTFTSERRYTVGDGPLGIAAADFDGDGDVDLALARDDSSTLKTKVGLWANDGTAHFTRLREVTSVEEGAPSLVADDFNLDGKPDLVVGMVGTDHQVVMLNQGSLMFAQTVYVTGFSAWDLSSGDLDGDGDPDVVLATLGSSSTGDMSILRNRGDGTFKALRFASGFNPHDAAIADFDKDGRADIVVANGNTETGAIHLQRPGFRFGPPGLMNTDLFVGSIEHSDIDHDGDMDLAVSEGDPFGGTGFVQILMNNGRGVFRPGQLIDSGLTSRGGIGHVQPADLNGDGWDDLVWTINQFNEPVAPIVTSMNDGHGVFLPISMFVGTDANGYAAVGDVENDGDLDVISAQATERLAVYLNAGDGTFGAAKILPVAEFPGMVIARDLTGDGWVDLVTVHNGVYGSSKAITVLPSVGGGRFGPYKKYTVGQGPIEIVAADFDEDGDLDLATSNNGGDDISTFADESTTVLLNRGDGRFGPLTTYEGEAINYYLSEWAIAAADVDGDGKLDLLVSNVMGNDAGVYYGHGDGSFEPQQVRYGLQNGGQDMAVADFNGDGRVDIAASGYLQSVDPLFPPRGIVVLKNQGP
jgi:VCBS repeat protein